MDEQINFEDCNCLAIRQAARRVTQFYDHFLMQAGIRTTQFSVLANLQKMDACSINALAEKMIMDRTTLGRNILPLEREGLIEVKQGLVDRRSKELQLTKAGAAKLKKATRLWAEAQSRFESVFGDTRAADLRVFLRQVTASDLQASAEVR